MGVDHRHAGPGLTQPKHSLAADTERKAGATCSWGSQSNSSGLGPKLEDPGAFVQQVRPRGQHRARCTKGHLRDGCQGPARGRTTSYMGLRGHPPT